MSDEFNEFLSEALPDIDEVLAHQSVATALRPLRAAVLIVEHCIVEIKGDTKDDFHQKAWFGTLVRAINAWYENRYGNAFQHGTSRSVSTVVSIFGTPFRADVPLYIKEAPLPDNTFWLCFPITVMPNEDHMNWIVNPPNFDSSTDDDRRETSQCLIEASTHLRATHVNLMTADHKTARARSLAQGILPHLEKGALDIARSEPNGRSIAIWEFNFACELAIKTFLRQQELDPPNTHDIHRLHKMAIDLLGPNDMDGAVSVLPAEKVAVKHRYAELPSPSLVDAMSIYRAALRISAGYSQKLARNYMLNNAKFQLKIPPWFDQT